MTLIEEIPKLREIERAMTPGDWWDESGVIHAKHPVYWTEDNHLCCHPAKADTDEDAEGIAALRTAAPWLLEVAGCFQKGDATLLRKLHYLLDTYHPDNDEDMELIERLLEAAKIVEGKE